MIDIYEAQETLLRAIKSGESVKVPLGEALGRTLAVPVQTDVDYPPFDRSVMDGYAVRAGDVSNAPVMLRVAGQIAAGRKPTESLGPGEAIQINTGAPIPSGADAVVRVEETELSGSGEQVLVRTPVPQGQFITPRATYVSGGSRVLSVGTRLTSLALGAAASAGASHVTVYRRPKVAILSTGNELVEIDHRPTGAEIRNSNQHLLEALVTAAGAEPVVLGIARDDRDVLREKITAGLRSDVLCITGGVSMGAFDFVPDVLEALDASFHVHKIAIKPGRPTIFATVPDGTPVFARPGNPAGAFVAFVLLVRPALAIMEGRSGAMPRLVRAVLGTSVGPTAGRRTYIPARACVNDAGEWEVKTLSWHGSGDAFGMATANALIMRSPRSEAAPSGEDVMILPLEQF